MSVKSKTRLVGKYVSTVDVWEYSGDEIDITMSIVDLNNREVVIDVYSLEQLEALLKTLTLAMGDIEKGVTKYAGK